MGDYQIFTSTFSDVSTHKKRKVLEVQQIILLYNFNETSELFNSDNCRMQNLLSWVFKIPTY